ncbi:MAG: hypothetical protein NTX44_06590 [Ignavibacteriales bacterium]|nr:hypothetical protein [Ignavibacteriales bacterium]
MLKVITCLPACPLKRSASGSAYGTQAGRRSPILLCRDRDRIPLQWQWNGLSADPLVALARYSL